jgi:hypothetical protein
MPPSSQNFTSIAPGWMSPMTQIFTKKIGVNGTIPENQILLVISGH